MKILQLLRSIGLPTLSRAKRVPSYHDSHGTWNPFCFLGQMGVFHLTEEFLFCFFGHVGALHLTEEFFFCFFGHVGVLHLTELLPFCFFGHVGAPH
jgi:hypothetical protein